MKKLTLMVAGLLIVPFVALAGTSAVSALSVNNLPAPQTGSADVEPNQLVADVIDIALWVVAVLAVIMLIWGGIRYATSAGDANKVTAAKNTIIYAVLGLVVAIFAYAIIKFLVGELTT